MSILAAFLSIPTNGGEGPPSLDAVQQTERTFDVLTSLLEDSCAKGPSVIIFEDLHWCDPSTLEFLNRLVDRVETLPVLLLVTSRPGISVAWSDQPHVTTLVLNRITKRECEKMINSLANSDLLPERVVEEIVKRSDGIPLFLEEMARTLIEAQNQPNATGALERGVPASLQDMLMARLDRLATGKRIYQTAAAIGREFTIETARARMRSRWSCAATGFGCPGGGRAAGLPANRLGSDVCLQARFASGRGLWQPAA